MDYKVTQEQLIKFIPSFLKNRFPEIINVLFEDVNVMSWDEGKTKTIKKITIIIDNNNILKGEEVNVNNNNSFPLMKDITKSLKRNLGVSTGNQWHIKIYSIEYKELL